MVGKVFEKKGSTTAVGCGRKFRKDGGLSMYHDSLAEKKARELGTSVEDAGFSPRTIHQLRNHRMAYIIDITRHTEGQLAVMGLTSKATREMKGVLTRMGLELGMQFSVEACELVGAEMKRMQKAPGKKSDSYIKLKKDGTLETNLSPEALRTIVRIAKKELEELRDDLKPHRIKVVGEFIDLFVEK